MGALATLTGAFRKLHGLGGVPARPAAAPSPRPRPVASNGFAVAGQGDAGLEAGGSARRLRNFRPSQQHINSLIAAAGATVQQRARWLTRNNAYAIAAVQWWGDATIGAGITPSWILPPEQAALKASLRATWDDWVDDADAEGLVDLYGLMRRGAREIPIAGEVFYRRRDRRPEDGLDVPLQIQMLPSEMLDAGFNSVFAPTGNDIRQGIEFDKIGRRVAYHFWRTHPGDSTEPQRNQERTRVPASEVLHLMDAVEAGQIRGLTRFSNAIVPLFTLDLYDDAELERKKTAALFAGFVKRIPQQDAEVNILGGTLDETKGDLIAAGPDEGAVEAVLEPGTMQTLLDGEDVTFSTPADVGGNYEAFQFRNLLRIATALGVPYYSLTGDMTRGNYGNTRASSLDAKKRVESFQFSVFVFAFCRRVAAWWLEAAALAGAVPGLSLRAYTARPRQFLKIRWMPPPWEWVDPKKDMEADVLAVDNGFRARSEVMERNGYDAAETDRLRAEDMKREKELGLTPPAPKPGASAAAAAPAPDDPEEDDTTDPARRAPAPAGDA